MRKQIRLVLPLLAAALLAHSVSAASPEAEQTFLDAYKAAYEAEDPDAFAALMQIDGAIEEAIEFYLLNLTAELGGEISLHFIDLTDEQLAEVRGELPGLDGQPYKLMPPPYRLLSIDIVLPSGANGGAEVFVGDLGDRITISTPARP